jgi:hypothetical protein
VILSNGSRTLIDREDDRRIGWVRVVSTRDLNVVRGNRTRNWTRRRPSRTARDVALVTATGQTVRRRAEDDRGQRLDVPLPVEFGKRRQLRIGLSEEPSKVVNRVARLLQRRFRT